MPRLILLLSLWHTSIAGAQTTDKIVAPEQACTGDTISAVRSPSFNMAHWALLSPEGDTVLRHAGAEFIFRHTYVPGRYTIASYCISPDSSCNAIFKTIELRRAYPFLLELTDTEGGCLTPFSAIHVQYLYGSPPPAEAAAQWTDNGKPDTIRYISANGEYTFKVVSANGCVFQQTINVQAKAPLVATLGPDTTICKGQAVRIRAQGDFPPNASYLWNTGERTREIIVRKTGMYEVVVSAPARCPGIAHRIIIFEEPPQPPSGERRRYVCEGDSVTLGQPYPGQTYVWSTGETAAQIIAKEPGTYKVTIRRNACVIADSFELMPCGAKVFMPTAFTPRTDKDTAGLNDRYAPVILNVREAKLLVFNRWGQRLAEYKYDPSQKSKWGWDGYFNGAPCPAGIYVGYLEYYDEKDNVKTLHTRRQILQLIR